MSLPFVSKNRVQILILRSKLKKPTPCIPLPRADARKGEEIFWVSLPRIPLSDSLHPGLLSGVPSGVLREQRFAERFQLEQRAVPTELDGE